MQQTWLLDFDETLASGSITQAIQHAFPKFIHEHQLSSNMASLVPLLLTLQQRASQNPDPVPLLDVLFEQMGWPHAYQNQLLEDLWTNYQPVLFEDTVPFLVSLREKQQRIYIVSNNPRTLENAHTVQIKHLVDQIFTPQSCPDTHPKPHRSLWEYILAHEIDVDPATTTVVGDDPWSDGAFADQCGLRCWIVDRLDRFTELRSQNAYQWVRSLNQIML
jgi:FMN phosphatase YigB (HAD superfamily)